MIGYVSYGYNYKVKRLYVFKWHILIWLKEVYFQVKHAWLTGFLFLFKDQDVGCWSGVQHMRRIPTCYLYMREDSYVVFFYRCSLVGLENLVVFYLTQTLSLVTVVSCSFHETPEHAEGGRHAAEVTHSLHLRGCVCYKKHKE